KIKEDSLVALRLASAVPAPPEPTPLFHGSTKAYKRGHEYVIELGRSSEDGEDPAVTFAGGEMPGGMGYGGSIKIPDITVADGELMLDVGLSLRHRQQLIAHSVAIGRGNDLYLLPGTTVRI